MDNSKPVNYAPAFMVAVVADVLQIVLLPAVFAAGLSPANIVLDVIVFAFLTVRMGFHIELLPAIIAESVPFLSVAPTWTLAVFIIWKRSSRPKPPVK